MSTQRIAGPMNWLGAYLAATERSQAGILIDSSRWTVTMIDMDETSRHDWRNADTCDCEEPGCRSYLRALNAVPQRYILGVSGHVEVNEDTLVRNPATLSSFARVRGGG